MKKPSFQFYPSDWIIDPGLSTLDYFHIGVFVKLLCFASQAGGELRYREGGKPLTVTDLSNLLGLEGNKTEKTINTLLDHGCLRKREDDGCLYNARMVRDCQEAKEYYEAKKKASEAGVAARLKNRESNVEPNINQTSDCGSTKHQPDVEMWSNQKPTPSSSSSTSIDITLSTAHAREGRLPKNEKEAIDMCMGTGVPDSFIRDTAYPRALAIEFIDRGSQIRNWAQWVTNYYHASENCKKRNENASNKQIKKTKNTGLYDDNPVKKIEIKRDDRHGNDSDRAER